MKNTYSFFYAYMQFWVNLALRIFFKNIVVQGLEKLPKDRPLLYCANHQNAFLDALLIAVLTNTQPASLVRADIFQNPVAAKLLATLKMMPVYRIRDGIQSMGKNEAVFKACYSLLNDGGTLIIFPEGNHGEQRKVRPLKKGAARVAFGAQALRKPDQKSIGIVPIGINYSHHSRFRSNVMVSVGSLIEVDQHFQLAQENEKEALKLLTQEIALGIKAKTIDLQVGTLYSLSNAFLERQYPMTHRNADRVEDDFKQLKALNTSLNSAAEHNGEQLQHQLEHWKKTIGSYRKLPNYYSVNPFGLALLFPFYALGALAYFIPYKVVGILARKLFKDPQFIGSMKVAMGLVVFPVYLFAVLLTAGVWLGWKVALAVLLALVFLAWVTLKAWDIHVDWKTSKQKIPTTHHEALQSIEDELLSGH